VLTLRIDAELTGEISAQHTPLGGKSGVAFLAVGQPATQRFGGQAPGAGTASAAIARNQEKSNVFSDLGAKSWTLLRRLTIIAGFRPLPATATHE
jgi:hypothetical protein